MSTLFVQNTPEVDAELARRRALGLDGRDEVWEGVYHVAPHEHGRNGMAAMALSEQINRRARARGLVPGGSFNLGAPGDFRVPDLGFHRDRTPALYHPTAAIVVEVLSPGDETFAKVDFYAAHEVDELWVVDPLATSIRIWERVGAAYTETGSSSLLDLTADVLAGELDWPKG